HRRAPPSAGPGPDARRASSSCGRAPRRPAPARRGRARAAIASRRAGRAHVFRMTVMVRWPLWAPPGCLLVILGTNRYVLTDTARGPLTVAALPPGTSAE